MSLDNIPSGLRTPEVIANSNFVALDPGKLFARHDSATAGLTLGIYGGNLMIGTTPTLIADTTLNLTASTTNYVEATTAGVVSFNTSSFTAGRIQIGTAVTGTATITTWTDKRTSGVGGAGSGVGGTPTVVPNLQTGTSYTYLSTDLGKLVTHTNGSAIAGTLPQATGAFGSGWYMWVEDRGVGTLTITPTTSTIDGASTLVLTTGEGVLIASDGTNYYAVRGISPGGASPLTTKGDVWGFSTVNARIPVGSNGQVLTADSTQTLGLKWATASAATESIIVAASDETTALTATAGVMTFRMPYAFTLTGVRASLTTAQASGSIFTADINMGGTSVLSTVLTLDNTEKTSTTAATAAVIGTSALTDDAEITIDIDQIGDGSAKGLKIVLIGHQ
jgi:hypothetical protein